MRSMAEHYLEQGIEQGVEKGIAQGIEQGIAQGETRAKQAALLKLLHHRFQGVPEAVATQIHALHSPGELDALFEKLLTAERLEDIDWKPDPEA